MAENAIDPDWKIRTAAFLALENLVAHHGPEVTYDQIAQGFEVNGERIFFANRTRGVFWPRQMKGSVLSLRATVPRGSADFKQDRLELPKSLGYKLSGNERERVLVSRARDIGAPLIFFFGVRPSVYRPIWPVFVGGVDSTTGECSVLLEPGRFDIQRIGAPPALISEPEFQIQIAEVSQELLEWLARHPERLRDLSSRKFEQVVAEILVNQGFEVVLTGQTRDGGRDIQAAHKGPFGTFMYYVECKRYAEDRHVGVEIVRNLYGVVQHSRVTAGILATTSSFTPGAVSFAQEVQYQLSLRDFVALKGWLGKYLK
ncbi:restriction endonuclease [Corallococcus exiguus]|uniref:restriction endonuclease n=1 Tax=Corallococcus TaxID=83461 RepID=UPI000F85EA53|nr:MULTISPECIES: restriction endonuclease [Corallococcus]NNC15365.1 restriction endonuclease [Corallococcus exiguus]NRD54301.1 restriction endonuclease [Corallococcus exiguus]NRD67305.1 restriction endonuclease [Corallococcus exiguus]